MNFNKVKNEDLTEPELKTAYFFVRNRTLFKKILIVFLALFVASIYIFSIFNFINYSTQSKDYEQMVTQLNSDLIDYPLLNQTISPAPLQVISAKAFFISGSKYYLTCLVENINERWFAESFDYKFKLPNGFESKTFSTFILPGEKKFLTDFNETITLDVSNLSCEVSKIKWQKIKVDQLDLLEIPKQFVASDLEYTTSTGSDSRTVLTFNLVNNSIYSFWSLNLSIIPYQGTEIAGIDEISMKRVMSGERREVKIIWPKVLPYINLTDIKAEINVFDRSLFINPNPKPSQ